MWTCDDCGDSGMTVLVQQCPQCQHRCCKNCDIYFHKEKREREPFYPVTYQYDVLKKDVIPNILPSKRSPNAQLSSCSPALARFEKDGQEFQNLPADEGITPLSSVATPDLIMASDAELSSNYSTPSLEVIPTPTPPQESSISSRPFSDQDYMDSETEFETDDTESAEDLPDDEDTMEPSNYAIDILDSRLFLILGRDFELASRLIPQIHAQLQLGFGTEIGMYTASPSQGSRGAPETQGDLSVSTLTPGGRSSHISSPRNKRGRERDESEDRGDKSSSKRPRNFQDRGAAPRRRYACHFHKKDPARYCPQNDPKFNICLGRGNPQLRRMKDHYLKVHRPAQCERCYAIFRDRDELKSHRQAESPCQNQPDTLKEGIDDSQWAKVEPLFQVRRNLSASQKEQDDFEKWFKIWDILFPNTSRPPNPWVVVPNDAEGLLINFNSIIELDIERGVFQRDDHIHQRYERAFRLALQTHAAVSAPVESFNHSFLAINDRENSSAEHPSERQTTAEVLESSLGQRTSPQPTQQHMPRSHQDQFSPRLETQSVPPSPRQFEYSEDTCISQPSNESITKVCSTPNTSTIFESPPDFRGTTINQRHLVMSSSTERQSNGILPGENSTDYQAASNTEQRLGPSELWDELDPAQGSYFDPWRNDLMALNTNDFEFEEGQLNSDSLTKILESENEGLGEQPS